MTEPISSSPETLARQLAQGISAAQAGQREQAHRLLAEVVQCDPQNDLAWLWLATVVETPEQRAACIARAVAANPERRPGQHPLPRLAPRPPRPVKRRFSPGRPGWLWLALAGLLLCLGGMTGLIWVSASLLSPSLRLEQLAWLTAAGTPTVEPLGVAVAPATPSSMPNVPPEEILTPPVLSTPASSPFAPPAPQISSEMKEALAEAAPQSGLVESLSRPDRRQALLTAGSLIWLGTEQGLIRWDQAAGTLARFTTADGLPDNDVRALASTGESLWMGTGNAGVARFDGQQWTIFRAADGLADDRVTVIGYQAYLGNVWVGTPTGLSRYSREDEWQTFTTADGLPGEYITALAFDPRSTVAWVSVQADHPALARLESGETRWTTVEAGRLGLGSVSALAPSEEGGLWAGTETGQLAYFDGRVWKSLNLPEALKRGAIRFISGDSSWGLWVGVEGSGIGRYDGQTWEVYTQTDDSTSLQSAVVTLDDQEQLWVATDQGLYQFSEPEFISVDPDPAAPRLASAWITDLAVDTQGKLWIATLSGIMRRDPVTNTWETFTSEQGLSYTDVDGLAVDKAGKIYAAHRGGQDSQFDGQTWTRMEVTNVGEILRPEVLDIDPVRRVDFAKPWPADPWPDLTGGLDEAIRINAIALDANGQPWLATSKGIWEKTSGAWVQVTLPGGLANSRVYTIFVDRAGQVWVGLEDGAGRFDPHIGLGSWEQFNTSAGLAHHRVLTIFEAADGTFWFGTANGLSQYDGTTWRSFTTTANGWPIGDVIDIVQDQTGALWAASTGTLLRFDGQAWTIAAATNLGAGNIGSNSFVDRDGEVWLSMLGGGLLRFDGTTWSRVDERVGLPGDWFTILVADEAGGLWAGSNSQPSLAHFDGETWQVISAVGDLQGRSPAGLEPDGAGGLWVVWEESRVMSHFQNGVWQNFALPDEIKRIDHFLLARSGGLWLGNEEVVARWLDGAWKLFTLQDLGYSEDEVQFGPLVEDSIGRIWLSTDGYDLAPQNRELRRYDGREWTRIRMPPLLTSIHSLVADTQGGVWLDGDQVVAHYDDEHWWVYPVPIKGAGRTVLQVALDSSGRVWVRDYEGWVWLSPHEGRWESRLVFQD